MSASELLVIGAGPYGLATAAYAQARGLDCRIVGEPMQFWREHMPRGMLLRSGSDWQLDALEQHTFEAFLAARDLDPAAVLPIAVELYIEYAAWFQQQRELAVDPTLVTALRQVHGGYVAEMADGRRIEARNVAVATGISRFGCVPPEVVRDLPASRYAHTCDCVDFAPLRGKRCLIIGGRQSAFEWAALMHEAGAAAIHLVYRHPTPRFVPSDWSWIDALLDETLRTPGWWRGLPTPRQEEIAGRFWAEGRLKLEPWLPPRLASDRVTCWPERQVRSCAETAGGEIAVLLDDGSELRVDQILLATGYRVDATRLPFLADSLLTRLHLADGAPALDAHCQANLPGLFFPGMTAVPDFGPFFGFVRGCPVAARLIVDHLADGR